MLEDNKLPSELGISSTNLNNLATYANGARTYFARTGGCGRSSPAIAVHSAYNLLGREFVSECLMFRKRVYLGLRESEHLK